ncbi:hypothetical protein [Bradyrhizobium sp. CCBAU 51765]|uniref:hypothetical protein n=1 Tax=Bradyrhizobium sp. CCBAU 51765 TaxID=1325102 RepID=UPI0018883AE2|nr:hypothetical protein [Bradyrhizobium sp. CCBAU 51765]QOZ09558.1 hypothetical protein XH96_19980 [Bradyrhizobium sp. CCBAU 51765]
MQTADWALIIGVFSLVVSAAGFLWNVWSKFIYPKTGALGHHPPALLPASRRGGRAASILSDNDVRGLRAPFSPFRRGSRDRLGGPRPVDLNPHCADRVALRGLGVVLLVIDRSSEGPGTGNSVTGAQYGEDLRHLKGKFMLRATTLAQASAGRTQTL